MSAEIVSNNGGLLTARIRGRLTQPELAALQAAAQEGLCASGRGGVLILIEDFEGWRDGDDWSDVSSMENDPSIRKMAIVGWARWQEAVPMFAASPVRKFPVRYFPTDEMEQAKAWLEAA